MNIARHIKRRVTGLGKNLAYSSLGTEAARRVLSSPSNSAARQFVKKKGLEGSLRRVASGTLPPGTYFAKLTIARWREHNGSNFRLLQGSKVVYGNRIEPPARGFPLEYRNIVVTSDDPTKFTIDIDVPYELKIGRGAFTTTQQLKYDKQYGVEQHGDVFYSIRGNTKNPKRMLITFPGFGPSTTRISYAVSYLKALTDQDLKDTVMVCFQDRYLSAGSYMMVDAAGRPLYGRVCAAINQLLSRYKIGAADVLMFGASKGASIAIHYAQEYPDARLLLAVPQMNLPYYFNKPFFRDNLFRNKALRAIEQPESALRRYFAEGRTIDYFYTNSDELSNHSLIEFVRDVPNLTKYRVNGAHSDVAKTALPAMLGIIRAFLQGGSQNQNITCEQARVFEEGNAIQLQVRVDPESAEMSGANWFLEGQLGRTRFLQLMSNHAYGFVKYTSEAQRLSRAYDPVGQLAHVVAIGPRGTIASGELPQVALAHEGDRIEGVIEAAQLSLASGATAEHAVLDGTRLGRFRYKVLASNPDGHTLEVHFVSDIEAEVPALAEVPVTGHASHVIAVQLRDGWDLADVFVVRLLVAAGVEHVQAVIYDLRDDPEAEGAFAALEWPHVTVVRAEDAELRTEQPA
ncbi:hypothetical protein [Paenarthrobacter sp. YJN-5]|uniref:hypothetical protein n=1 Tax=Paenarthrobacter sp. YJN-5 TaxID=2735316 RepID=UPI0018785FB1|nr:hypothetical protein [Paenarthrobacter sp. YJN-5]QOT16040.1 hypothetical protein HMI59_05155 [Paenarthrobacter sp. YJN-5]